MSNGELKRNARRPGDQDATNGAAPVDESGAARSDPALFDRRLQNHRTRQASVASILDATFGKLGECAPELWGHRAYLMLVGVAYERLAADETEVSTDELLAIAKVIAENRRLEVRLREIGKSEPDNDRPNRPPGDDHPLPDHFGAIVQRVYGANYADTDDRDEPGQSE